MPRIIIFGTVVVLILTAIFFNARRETPKTSPSKIKVAASFYIPAEFARQIGGERVEVISIEIGRAHV